MRIFSYANYKKAFFEFLKLTVVRRLVLYVITIPIIRAMNTIYADVVNITEEFMPGAIMNISQIVSTNNVSVEKMILLKSPSSDAFLLDGNVLKLVKPLDREALCESLKCSCTQNCILKQAVLLEDRSGNTIISIPIFVVDINDNAPKFSRTFFHVFVKENVDIGYKIPVETANDKDSKKYAVCNYSLIDAHDIFTLDFNQHNNRLELTLLSELDRELRSEHHLQIIANECEYPFFAAKMNVTIHVTDINDNKPEFEQDIYEVHVLENNVHTEIIQVRAIDADEGPNALVFYSFVNREDELYFDINSTTGMFSQKLPLNFEEKNYYKVLIEASDCGINKLKSHCCIEVHVKNTNDPPKITLYFEEYIHYSGTSVELPETIHTPINLGKLCIQDEDVGDKHTLFINNSLCLKAHPVNVTCYKLYFEESLDREAKETYQLSLRAIDDGIPPMYTDMVITINVSDVNDNAPAFFSKMYNFSVFENHESNLKIGEVNAYDLDIGENGRFYYEIEESDDGKMFRINHLGEIYAVDILNYEKQDVFTFNVFAVDKGNPPLSGKTKVLIEILNYNEYSPIFDQTFYNFAVVEHISNDTLIGSLKVIDRDKNDNVTLTFSNDKLPFYMDGNHNIFINSSFDIDREEREMYEFYVTATDSLKNPSRRSTSARIIVVIEDINDHPPRLVKPVKKTIHIPNFLQYQNICELEVFDADKGANARTIILIDENPDQLFYIHDTYLMTNRTKIEPKTYNVILKICDEGIPQLCVSDLLRIIAEQTRKKNRFSYYSVLITCASIVCGCIIASFASCLYISILRHKKNIQTLKRKSIAESYLSVNDEKRGFSVVDACNSMKSPMSNYSIGSQSKIQNIADGNFREIVSLQKRNSRGIYKEMSKLCNQYNPFLASQHDRPFDEDMNHFHTATKEVFSDYKSTCRVASVQEPCENLHKYTLLKNNQDIENSLQLFCSESV